MDKQNNVSKSIAEYVNIILVCLLAFGGSYFILPKSGILSTLMLIIPFAFACALLKVKGYVKVLSFAGFGYIMSTIYTDSAFQSLLTGIICGALVVLAMITIWLFRQKKPLYIALGSVIIALTALFHVMVMGNPVNAFNSKELIQNYYEDNFDKETVSLSGTYYDREKAAFRADIYDKDTPSLKYPVYIFGKTVNENYSGYVEKSLMEGKRIEITNALRRVYPNATFYVKPLSISAFPRGKISPSDGFDYSGRMSFIIYIPNDLTVTRFKERIKDYTATLCNADTGVEHIYFCGGIADEYYRVIPYYISAIPLEYNRYPVSSNLTEEYIWRSVFPEF